MRQVGGGRNEFPAPAHHAPTGPLGSSRATAQPRNHSAVQPLKQPAQPLSRLPAQPASAAHRFPRRSCSRSIASNSALKFPLPKPIDPCRSIISKKTVGRSWTGFVKICSR